MKVKKIGIVSLSSGVLGEDFVKHEVKIGVERLKQYGIEVDFLPHALKGMDFIKEHPECRAMDLLSAFKDDSIDMILCAIGGDDTYRLLPYLFENNELANAVKQKIFLGFSDTTFNHFMLNKLGIKTFYGQSFLSDICELANEMLPYTRKYFEELIFTGRIKEIRPSDIHYKEREDFSENGIGVDMESYPNKKLYLEVRFWVVVLILSMIFLTIPDMRIRFHYARNMTSFQNLKNGRAKFFFSKQVRKNRNLNYLEK